MPAIYEQKGGCLLGRLDAPGFKDELRAWSRRNDTSKNVSTSLFASEFALEKTKCIDPYGFYLLCLCPRNLSADLTRVFCKPEEKRKVPAKPFVSIKLPRLLPPNHSIPNNRYLGKDPSIMIDILHLIRQRCK